MVHFHGCGLTTGDRTRTVSAGYPILSPVHSFVLPRLYGCGHAVQFSLSSAIPFLKRQKGTLLLQMQFLLPLSPNFTKNRLFFFQKMAKKKTNGFHLFANSRRSAYEMQSGGRRLSQKMVIEMASHEWSSLTKTEQAAWLSRPKVQPAAKVTPNPFISQGRSGNGGGGSNTRGGGGGTGSHGNGPQAQVKKSHVVEQELVKRTYKTGLDRATAREEFYGNLLWREKDRLVRFYTCKILL